MPPRRAKTQGSRCFVTVDTKIEIVQEYLKSGKSAYAIAKKHGVQTGQVIRWAASLEHLKATAEKGPGLMTINPGRKVEKPDVEAEVLEFYEELRNDDLAVSTKMLVLKAMSIDRTFHSGDRKKLNWWVYDFLERNDLSIRRPTRQGQKISGHLQAIKDDFVGAINARFLPFGTLANVSLERFVNMDETPVNFEPEVITTVAKKGSKTVPARVCSSHNSRVTVCLAITATGAKLPPYVVLKGVPGARHLSKKAWMDADTTHGWLDAVWKPFATAGGPSLLLLDDYKCHKQSSFATALAKLDTELEIIPGGYTCVLQPLDVGIMKPFKDRIRHEYMMWAVENMAGKISCPSPSREIVLTWIDLSWSALTHEMILNVWRRCGYSCEV
ncbi:hypothetical protein Ae201684P_016917 [Aphanomyces euteiches]|nr:hypothetical protein Ae201684P_016917 [Aphanomyces euteiches]KAH9140611.1 hypothetical protein AeRB84_015169 [Aphanomyces euteiches]